MPKSESYGTYAEKNYLCGPFVELFYTNGHNSTLLTNGS